MAKINNTFYIILGTLNYGPQSGYDIKKSIEGSTGEFWKVNYGQIYPLLKTMVGEDFARLITDDEESKHDRKAYAITEKGVKAFLEWLSQPINFSDPNGSELLVKLFFGKDMPVRDNILRLTEYKEKCVDYLLKMKNIQRLVEGLPSENPQTEYSMIAVRHGQIMIQAKIDWCDECIEKLNKNLTE